MSNATATAVVIEFDVPTDNAQPADCMAPRLDTAPDLLYNLGFCLAVSSTRSVARVVLPESAPAGPALSTNMIRIANEGSNAFLGAYKDLLSIANSSEELSQDGGLLDQLGGLLVQGGSKASKNLVYSWVQDCVDGCSEAGSRTAGNFDNWRKTVQDVFEAVDTAKNTNEAKVKVRVEARKRTEHQASANKLETATAMEEVAFAVQRKEVKSEVYTRRVGEHEGRVSAQVKEYLYNPFWSAIKRPFRAAADKAAMAETANLREQAERELHEAYRELNQRRKAELVFRLKAERLRAQIDEYMDEEASLKDILSTITSVCELLGGLSSDVAALLHTFAHISGEIKTLVKISQRVEKPAGVNLGFTRINIFNKRPTFQVAKKGNDEAYMNRLFHQQILRMKQVCLGIHVLSRLYADIINNVINYGFAEALRQSYDDLDGEASSIRAVLRERKKRMKRWHAQAISACRERNRAAAREFQARLDGMNTSAGCGAGAGTGTSTSYSYPPFGGSGGTGGRMAGYPPGFGHYGSAGTAYPAYEAPNEPPGEGRFFVMSPSTGRPREVYEA